MGPLVLMGFVEEIPNSQVLTEREAIFADEFQHILDCQPPLVFLCAQPAPSQCLKRARDHFFGRMKASGAELLLNQLLTVWIEANVHAPIIINAI
jgi:hypothetical protein